MEAFLLDDKPLNHETAETIKPPKPIKPPKQLNHLNQSNHQKKSGPTITNQRTPIISKSITTKTLNKHSNVLIVMPK